MKGMLNNFSPGTAKGLFGGTNDKEALKKMRTFLGSEQFFQVWSQYIVALSVAELGMPPLAEEELKAKAAQVRKSFPVPFRLMATLLQRLATAKPPELSNPKRKRWNFVWDSMISFAVGDGTIDGAPVQLVTNDGDLVEAAAAAGHANQVVGLVGYLKAIGIS